MNSLSVDILEFPSELQSAMHRAEIDGVRAYLPAAIEGDNQHPRLIDIFAHIAVGMSASGRPSSISRFQLQAVEFALDQGANPNYIHAQRSLLGMSAAQTGTELMKLLLERGADINDVEPSIPPLAVAIEHHNRANVDFLLANGANPNAICINGTPMVFYAARGQRQHLLPHLQKAGADFHAMDKEGGTMVHAWLRGCTSTQRGMISRDQRTLNKLIAMGVDPGMQDVKGQTPRDVALRNKQPLEAQALALAEAEFVARALSSAPQATHRRASSRL